MAAREITISITARRRWWLKIMLPTMIMAIWLMPRWMKRRLDCDEFYVGVAGLVRRGLVITVDPTPLKAG